MRAFSLSLLRAPSFAQVYLIMSESDDTPYTCSLVPLIRGADMPQDVYTVRTVLSRP